MQLDERFSQTQAEGLGDRSKRTSTELNRADPAFGPHGLTAADPPLVPVNDTSSLTWS